MITKLQVLTLGSCLISAVASAQSASPISTDRPTFSDCVSLLSKGQWQFESGTTSTSALGSTMSTYGELLTRYGFSDRIEFRLSNVTLAHVPGQTTGFEDPSMGFKFWLQTGSAKRPDLTAEFMTTVPAGGTQFRVNRSQPTAKLIWNQQVDSNTGIAGNFLVSDLGASGARFTQWAQSVYVSRTINPNVGLFAEAYRLDPISYAGPSASFYDAGVTYLLNKNLQLDARFVSGFDSQRDGHAIGAGISYRY